jgi:Beige/BEACH domain
MQRWIEGDVSNFDYLMMINYAAGRRMGDASHHPILPWVTDFSSPDGSLRDLSKSKFRLHKGDAQLSMTFTTSTPQHHIPEPPLSDLTYFVYLARKVPMDVLKSQVRAEFRPAEYPTSMARMYSWSPDECIPEFFMDASVFVSHHTSVGLHDLGAYTLTAFGTGEVSLDVLCFRAACMVQNP